MASVHIEQRVSALVLTSFLYIMVPEHGMEFDVVLQKAAKRFLEFLDEVTRGAEMLVALASRI